MRLFCLIIIFLFGACNQIEKLNNSSISLHNINDESTKTLLIDSFNHVKSYKPCFLDSFKLESVSGEYELYSNLNQDTCLILDTIFKNIRLIIRESYLPNSFLSDTFSSKFNEKIYVRKIYNTEFDFEFFLNSKIQRFSLSKFKDLDSLYSDKKILSNSVFGSPYLDSVDLNNKQIFFSVFFGFPQSDAGEILQYKINFTEGLKFVKFKNQDDYDF